MTAVPFVALFGLGALACGLQAVAFHPSTSRANRRQVVLASFFVSYVAITFGLLALPFPIGVGVKAVVITFMGFAFLVSSLRGNKLNDTATWDLNAYQPGSVYPRRTEFIGVLERSDPVEVVDVNELRPNLRALPPGGTQ